MTNEVFHINIDGYKSESQYTSIIKSRLWPAMLSSLQWLIKNPIPGHNLIQSGVGLLVINNLAILVEGFIADIIIEHLDSHEAKKPREIMDIEKATWRFKRNLYDKTFQNKLESYREFKSIEILFLLRNNISHGRTHLEMIKTDILSGEKSLVESMNKNYQIVRTYFVEKGFLHEIKTSSSIEILWRLDIAAFLFSEVKSFLFSVLKNNESQTLAGISAELNNATQI